MIKTTAGQLAAEIIRQRPDITVNQIVPEVIKRHTAQGCEFFHGAEQRIIANCNSLNLKMTDLEQVLGFMDYEESYCPHEGVDKRH
jgi:hypothetical protein